ncbi:MAG: site-specific integrase [Crocinitomicaceae bacterium]|nr:site-specific integrase [Crocinitomicaceae bacterium]
MSSRTSFGLTFYINRTRERKNGECPVMLRININGDRVALQVHRFIKPEDWDPARYVMKGRTEVARVFNNYLEAVRLKANKKYNELLSYTDDVTPQMLRDAILGVNTAKTRQIIDIWEGHVSDLKKLIGKENSYATYQKYNTAKNHFQSFLQKKYQLNDLSIKAVDYQMIQQYGIYLKTEKGCSFNTATKFLQNLKTITSISIRSGWLVKDPFNGISLTLKEVDRHYLTFEELERLMKFNSVFDRLNRVRDFFVFSCYTGLAYIDVKKLKRAEIEGNDEMGFWIRTRRQKTGGRANIPLLDIPMSIIRNYCQLELLESEDPILPILSNQKMNTYLKELADLCNIQKQLSYHVARHTFATTVTMMNGVPIETVSKMLGHKNIHSTQHYARIVDKKVGDDMKLLASKLNGHSAIHFKNTNVESIPVI